MLDSRSESSWRQNADTGASLSYSLRESFSFCKSSRFRRCGKIRPRLPTDRSRSHRGSFDQSCQSGVSEESEKTARGRHGPSPCGHRQRRINQRPGSHFRRPSTCGRRFKGRSSVALLAYATGWKSERSKHNHRRSICAQKELVIGSFLAPPVRENANR
jgi:hypothetical protein